MAEVSKSGTDGHPVSLMALGRLCAGFRLAIRPILSLPCGAATRPGDSYCEKCQAIGLPFRLRSGLGKRPSQREEAYARPASQR